MEPLVLVVCGPSGCGKTSVGQALARRIDAHFLDADRLHSAECIGKMRAQQPLDDDDRLPWLASVGLAASQSVRRGQVLVVACSALRRRYRAVLAASTTTQAVRFVLLDVDAALLERRLRARAQSGSHFFSGALLRSQLQTLERPSADQDPDDAARFLLVAQVDAADVDVPALVERIVAKLAAAPTDRSTAGRAASSSPVLSLADLPVVALCALIDALPLGAVSALSRASAVWRQLCAPVCLRWRLRRRRVMAGVPVVCAAFGPSSRVSAKPFPNVGPGCAMSPVDLLLLTGDAVAADCGYLDVGAAWVPFCVCVRSDSAPSLLRAEAMQALLEFVSSVVVNHDRAQLERARASFVTDARGQAFVVVAIDDRVVVVVTVVVEPT